MDEHSKVVVSGLLMYSFESIDWDFDRLTDAEKQIIGNQVQLDVLHKFCNVEFEKAMAL